ncbi:enoyl-CoA hydratase/isomerase family protein [Phytoactinopolyspora limicola]|uniref:enoyl-CoA hydratase/isomerase family protein n=1 Tax=Phytoactinopolyspora limicola TaxID=2715536 RepID=UPI001408ED2F|nr:enoyl-CoA hydratase-related protein [Phytoactinopolyspora limicola]
MGQHDEPKLLTSTQDGVRVLTLNRPRARNALDSELLQSLFQALDEAATDPDVGAVLLTGTGPAFCAGFDMKEAMSRPRPEQFWDRYTGSRSGDRIYNILPLLPKPVITAVNGFAVGAGAAIAISSDIVLAADSAKLGYPEVNHGIVAATAAVSLSRTVGRLQALELLLTGRMLEATEAQALGLVTRVVPAAELADQALALATELAAKPPVAMRMTKEMFRHVQEMDYDRALEYARDVGQLTREAPAPRPSEH